MNDKITTNARTGKVIAEDRPVDAPRSWFVYDDNATDIGGKSITKKDDERVVIMTAGEAQYYLDQGTIGEKALDRRSAKATEVIEQVTGAAEPPKTRK